MSIKNLAATLPCARYFVLTRFDLGCKPKERTASMMHLPSDWVQGPQSEMGSMENARKTDTSAPIQSRPVNILPAPAVRETSLGKAIKTRCANSVYVMRSIIKRPAAI
jgi:hypothetical protein